MTLHMVLFPTLKNYGDVLIYIRAVVLSDSNTLFLTFLLFNTVKL